MGGSAVGTFLGAGRGGRRLRGLLGGRPCDHAATVSSSVDLKVPQIQFIDSGLIFLLFAETGTPSANCAVLRRDSPGAVLELVVHVPVIVQRHTHSARSSRSSTSLSWRRGCPLVLNCSENHCDSFVAVHRSGARRHC